MEFEVEKSFHVLREAGRVPSLVWTQGEARADRVAKTSPAFFLNSNKIGSEFSNLQTLR